MMCHRDPSSLSGTQVKLPKLIICLFNKTITKWTTFWDSFELIIDSSAGLSDMNKFNYLRSLLNKSAGEAISGLTPTSSSYKEAIPILKRQFGNKKKIIAHHNMENFLNLNVVSSQNNLKGLQHLYNLVETQICSLKSHGVGI